MDNQKPVIFISHAHADKDIVALMKDQIDRVFSKSLKVWASSIDGVIKTGDKWFEEIQKAVAEASIAIFVITPNSAKKQWIWFEMGALWRNVETKKVRLLPVCFHMKIHELEAPLNSLQAKSLDDSEHITQLFEDMLEFLKEDVNGNIENLQLNKFRKKSKPQIDFSKDISVPASSEDTKLLQYRQELEDVLGKLTQRGILTGPDIEVFRSHDLISLTKERELKKLEPK